MPVQNKIKILLSCFQFVCIIFLIMLFSLNTNAQNKKEKLINEKKQLEKEIAYTNQLLSETRKTQQLSLNQLIILNNQIEKREQLIKTINTEIHQLDEQIAVRNSDINRLSAELNILKAEYAKMIVFAYKNRNAYSRLMFIFAAKDFNQAYLRLKYFQQYNAYRRKQAELIVSKQQELNIIVTALDKEKKEKNMLLLSQQKETKQLNSEKENKNKNLQALKDKEKDLLANLREKEKLTRKLNKAIEEIIAKEIKESTKNAPKGTTKTGVYSLTPYELELSNNFAGNQGKLPWPSERGIIVSTFGEHPHPVLSGIKIKNNGVDIATTIGAKARAIFDGKVVSSISIPGANKAVIIRHGEYLTVYSNLNTVFVKVGDQVKTRQEIGSIATNDNENRTELHLEIWKGKEILNPLNWLASSR